MLTDEFDFHLPAERIAQEAVWPRDAARLFFHTGGRDRHLHVRDLASLLAPGDLIVVNNTKVLPARVRAHRATGGAVEALFLEPAVLGGAPGEDGGSGPWRALVKPAKKLKPGEVLECDGNPEVLLRMLRRPDAAGPWELQIGGRPGTRFEGLGVEALLGEVGAMPLPPYIERAATDEDAERYQTIYAAEPGAVAAPTAGLHFTEEVFAGLSERGVERAEVTLHVGAGTFLPVTASSIDDHQMHSERFSLPGAAADAVRACRERGGRVIPIGTTAARVLESCAAEETVGGRALVNARSGVTDIFLHPGSPPRVCDGLFTNFHLPKSTLLMLVAAFMGKDEVLDLYQRAIDSEYRFYSYGDAMLLI